MASTAPILFEAPPLQQLLRELEGDVVGAFCLRARLGIDHSGQPLPNDHHTEP